MTRVPIHRQPLCRGFTLIEVMVALAVLALATLAIMQNVTLNVSNAAALRDRTLAHWVAMNKVVEQQVSNDWPAPGEYKDRAMMAGREWYWKVIVRATERDDMRRMDVEVRSDEDGDKPLASLVSYVEQP